MNADQMKREFLEYTEIEREHGLLPAHLAELPHLPEVAAGA